MEKQKTSRFESLLPLLPLILSGGLQDSYTFFYRGGVFANAQTGNIVLLSASIFNGEFGNVAKYLIPVCFFILGALLAKAISFLLKNTKRINWRQIVLLIECLSLLGACFIPESQNVYSSSLVSFACAMQVITFSKICGNDFASTMCIGNMIKMCGCLVSSVANKDLESLKKFFLYLLVIVVFALGAGSGFLLQKYLGRYAILFSAGLAFLSSLFMFGKEEVERISDAK